MTVDSLQEPATPAAEPLTPSAGTLLRGYRESLGIRPEALATKLHVPLGKLQALENDRLDALPDAMFARALALAICRQLQVDAAPVLARLPQQDVSRLATHNERGLDFPLKRPSLLPASGLHLLLNMPRWQWIGLAVALLAALFVANPWSDNDAQAVIHGAVTLPAGGKGASEVVTPLSLPASIAPPVVQPSPVATEAQAPVVPPPVKGTSTVITPLQPNSVVLTPVVPAAAAEGGSK